LALTLLILGVLFTGFVCSRYGRAATVSALFLPDMLIDLPVRPVTWITPDPVVERTLVDYGDGRIVTDIYRPPGDGRHPAIIFSMGAPPLPLDDPRLRKLGEDAARAGIVMLVPFSTRLDAELIEPEEIDALVGLFEYAERQPYIRPDRIGYIGVSVGGSLALVAAADPRIADRVDYVVSFGGYYDAVDAFLAIGSREIRYNGLHETWEPDPHAVEVMALQVLTELPRRSDREVLCKAFVDPWDWADLCGVTDTRPLTDADLARLSPEGRAAYDFVSRGDPALLDAIPPATLRKLERLSPSRVIDRIRGELFIIHDRSDAFIPYVESRRMRDALEGRGNVRFTEVALFEHVEPRLSRGGDVVVVDGVRLYYRLYQLLLRLS
jgi:pimeloyl-ACP methyl ester carboxylesterase